MYLKVDSTKTDLHLEDNVNEISKTGLIISKHRESLVSIQRSLNFIYKSEQIKLSTEDIEKFTDLIDQVSILEEHIDFLNDKLSFLLDINFGLLNIQQNAITKALSIAALIFLPPAIVSGIFGMNFDKIPLTHLNYGFEIALLIGILSATVPYLFCKFKRWI